MPHARKSGLRSIRSHAPRKISFSRFYKSRSFLRLPMGRKVWISAVVIAAVALLAYVDNKGWLLVPAGDDLDSFDRKSFLVTRVIDGDTIEIAAVDKTDGSFGVRVRLWGIDCPEMPNFGKPAEPWAAQATAFTTQLCMDQFVTLELEPHRMRDTYDRLLAHVVVSDTNINVSEAILRAGLAHADERWRHDMMELYRRAEADARKKNAGLWSSGFVAPPAPGR